MLTLEQIREIASGNEPAAQFLAAFLDRAHLLDDLVDRDEEVTQTDVITGELDWLMVLSGNEFFLRHKASLIPLMVVGLTAWRDSDMWRRSTDRKRQVASDVIKGWYHEVAFYTAFLCGGLGHMQMMTAKYRDYDFEVNL